MKGTPAGCLQGFEADPANCAGLLTQGVSSWLLLSAVRDQSIANCFTCFACRLGYWATGLDKAELALEATTDECSCVHPQPRCLYAL